MILWKHDIFGQDSLMNRTLKKKKENTIYLEIAIFFYFVHVFTVTFDHLMSLLNKSINLFLSKKKKKSYPQIVERIFIFHYLVVSFITLPSPPSMSIDFYVKMKNFAYSLS